MTRGYRGFPSKAAYEDYYSDPAKYAAEIPAMEAYTRECVMENNAMPKMPEKLKKHIEQELSGQLDMFEQLDKSPDTPTTKPITAETKQPTSRCK